MFLLSRSPRIRAPERDAMRLASIQWLHPPQCSPSSTTSVILSRFGSIKFAVQRQHQDHSEYPRFVTCTRRCQSTTATSSLCTNKTPLEEDRRLFRALLRECTYLPDPNAAQWVRQQILSRFRSYQFKSWQHRDDNTFQNQLTSIRAKGRRELHLLQRANHGDHKALLKILLFAYGRRGKRRRELMQSLIALPNSLVESSTKTEKPQNTEHMTFDAKAIAVSTEKQPEDTADEAQSRGKHKHKQSSRPQFERYMPQITSQLRALSASQSHIHFRSFAGLRSRAPGKLQPNIPELNSWFRPMPQCRVKNMTKAWYGLFLDRILPPLPLEEWLHLHDFATGKLRFLGQAHRRPGIHQQQSALHLSIQVGKVNKRTFSPESYAGLTPRSVKRRWIEVFSVCPVLYWNAKMREWNICWGQQALNDESLVTELRHRYKGDLLNPAQRNASAAG